MARRAKNKTGRVLFNNARQPKKTLYKKTRLPRSPRLTLSTTYTLSTTPLNVLEDRRTFYPSPVRPVFGTDRLATRLTAREPVTFRPQLAQTKAIIAFADPNKIPLCTRRKRRKQVLHALKIAGGTGFKKPRRNAESSISCKG